MKYQIHISEEDYVRFNIFHASQSNQIKNMRMTEMLFAILLPAITAFDALFLLIEVKLPSLQVNKDDVLFLFAMVFFSLFYILWYLYHPKIIERKIRRNIRKLKTSGKLPYHADSRVEFQDEKIVETSEHGIFYIHYKDIEKIFLQNECFYIYSNIIQAVIIPFHCLGEDKERVLSYLLEKTPLVPKNRA